MDRKSILNQLKLAYSPLTNYEFTIVKNDPLIERALEKASLYVITQRPIITFENIVSNQEENLLKFEIHQRNKPNILKCKLPYLQDVFNVSGEHEIHLAINYIKKPANPNKQPIGNVYGFSLVEYKNKESRFLIWFSPEKLLQNCWRGNLKCEIDGDIREFLKYKVHYVGKATKQGILNRLTGHNTLQDILSLEYPFSFGELPTHEIAILCFEFQDNLEIQSFGIESRNEDIVAALMGENRPPQDKIFLDAEKALIKAMKPSYNKQLFNSYPISKDGLFDENYDVISYTFIDPITLEYENGIIEGGKSLIGGDSIIISDNEKMELVKSAQ
ncbi:hypothetical protein [Formosa algae]|uniref:Uncharacterized protein n=1 Tax=Formosa algae TaxID=225843 RepID=A0A9X0YMW2_9FLAO|nr:hypothetical protein [Formosa algae]MBP1841687.1 hypothetical protein [Formosa algae]MDQ0337112.1 hypothetical protein [Formosa algae]OEI80532.1 hypothetical protein AST99_08690 [Formosa algae]